MVVLPWGKGLEQTSEGRADFVGFESEDQIQAHNKKHQGDAQDGAQESQTQGSSRRLGGGVYAHNQRVTRSLTLKSSASIRDIFSAMET